MASQAAVNLSFLYFLVRLFNFLFIYFLFIDQFIFAIPWTVWTYHQFCASPTRNYPPLRTSLENVPLQEGDTAQADKHADIAIEADHYNPAGL